MKNKAKRFAEKAHDGQRRKFEGQPFVEHPKAVASILNSVAQVGKEEIAAALLHDTVEDTDTTLSEIRDRFGQQVYYLVKQLTTDKTARDEMGKAKYLGNKMVGMTTTALTIKLCDRYHNVRNIEDTPESFRTRYSRETEETIRILFQNRKLTSTQRKIAEKIIEKVT